MCIVFISIEDKPRYKYVILSNRDEDFARPTLPSDFWTSGPLGSSITPPNVPVPGPSPSDPQHVQSKLESEGTKGVEILAGS
jgi:hypothetical protein